MQSKRKAGGVAALFALGKANPGPWYGAVFLSILGILFEAFPYLSIYNIVRLVLVARQTGGALNAPAIWLWGGLTLASLVVSVVCTIAGGYTAHKVTFRFIFGLRRLVLAHLGKLPMGYFSSHSTGFIQKQMEAEMNKIEQHLAHNVPNLIGAAPLLIGLLGAMFVLNIWLALAVLAVCAAAVFIQSLVFSSKKSMQNVVEGSVKMGEMNRWFNEYLRGISVVKLFGGGHGFQNLENSILGYRNYLLQFTKRTSIPFSIFKVLMLSLLTFVLPVATILISLYGGQLQLVLTIIMFLVITPCLYSPMLELMRLATDMQQSNAAIGQIEALLKETPLPVANKPRLPANFEVAFEDVSFSYQAASNPMRQWALKEVSFTAPVGSVTALVGPSGGGKSTAGQLLCRFWDVTAGAIKIGGVDIREMAPEYLMDCVAFVFQDTYLFGASVYDNIAMSRAVTRKQVEDAAKAAMCHDFIMALPGKYDTPLGDGGQHLSGGEAQRIAIARAILKDSPIVVLDEATAFTDADNETLIQRALGRLLAGKTVFMIAHRLATIQKAQQILVLQNGALVQRGTHQALVSSEGIYQTLWNIQHEVEGWQLKKGGQKKGEKAVEIVVS
ncbi:MAG: ABC transporter ATP-binding protein [Oscillospiraceae bacterium]